LLFPFVVVRVWLPPTFEGVDPEQKISERYKQKVGANGGSPRQ
jgi:hypothetical protein